MPNQVLLNEISNLSPTVSMEERNTFSLTVFLLFEAWGWG